MTFIRPETKGKWKLSKHEFYTAYHYALQYNDWVDERDGLCAIRGVSYDGMPHGTGTSNPTEQKGIKLAELNDKITVIEETAQETDAELARWILKAVTCDNVTFAYLNMTMHIPCSANTYYERRRKFYWLLSHKIQLRKFGNHGT